jgi:hypothetical protein
MPEQRIEITIDEKGGISAKTAGFTGEACLEELEEILNKEHVSYIKKTDDFYKKEIKKTRNTIQRGR